MQFRREISSAVATARARSLRPSPIRVRRSRMSSTVSAPSWVTAYSNSARLTSMPSATGSVGRSQPARGDHVGRLGAVARHQRARQFGRRAQRRNGIRRRTDQRQVAGPAPARGQTPQRDGPVDDVLGHVPVLGQFAADHADDARRGLDDGMLTRHIGRADHIPGTRVDQRPQAGVGADDVVVAERGVQRGVDGVEQERDLRRASAAGRRESVRGILVGQPQVYPAELFGHREHEPVDLTGDRNSQRRSRIAERCGVEHQMGSAAGPQPDGVVDLARPHSRGVDDGAGRDVRPTPRSACRSA